MTNPIIQATAAEDIPALQLVLELTVLFPSQMLPEMLAPSLEGGTEAFWLTCQFGGKAMGFCYTAPEDLTDGTWNMLALAVHPEVQGQKLGTTLIHATERQLKETGQRMLIIDTSSAHEFEQARKFYTRNGFEEEARIRDFWAPGNDKVIFRKLL